MLSWTWVRWFDCRAMTPAGVAVAQSGLGACGGAFRLSASADGVRAFSRSLAHTNRSTDVLDQSQMARRFPMIDFEGIKVGLYEQQFGALIHSHDFY